jgi:thiamine transport system ATP-binding protein
MLTLYDVDHKYGTNNSFEFNLQLKEGESLAVIGPSGSGKTTLLDLIAGFITPISGEITFNNQNLLKLKPGKRPVNILFQKNNLFSHLNVFDNIAIAIDPSLKINNKNKQIIESALSRVGLSGFNPRFPHQLSGGQAQRIGLARVIVRNKPILLLDEPFNFLDRPLRLEMLDLVRNIQKEHNITVIMVTHDYQDAVKICDNACFLKSGKITHFASIKEFSNIIDPTIKTYIS